MSDSDSDDEFKELFDAFDEIQEETTTDAKVNGLFLPFYEIERSVVKTTKSMGQSSIPMHRSTRSKRPTKRL